jgi:hypothetical protein
MFNIAFEILDAYCGNARLLGKAKVGVSLAGKETDRMIHKSIRLNTLVGSGCGGTAVLGPLADAVKELGSQRAMVVLMSVDEGRVISCDGFDITPARPIQ